MGKNVFLHLWGANTQIPQEKHNFSQILTFIKALIKSEINQCLYPLPKKCFAQSILIQFIALCYILLLSRILVQSCFNISRQSLLLSLSVQKVLIQTYMILLVFFFFAQHCFLYFLHLFWVLTHPEVQEYKVFQ